MKKIVFLLLISLLFITLTVEAEITNYTYQVINSYPHDREAFTQGFTFKNGYIYEGTGLRGKSSLRKVELKSGSVKKIHHLANKYFGEGITILEDKIYQLTWEAGTGFIYDMNFNQIDQFDYDTEGWGLTNDGEFLIMSDGTSNLYFLDPKSQEVKKEITVTLNNKPKNNINEMEYIDGKIYANIWKEDYIIIIDPKTGKITGKIDLSGIINPKNYDHELNVLNGVTYNQEKEKLLVTGKLWSHIFAIKIKPK